MGQRCVGGRLDLLRRQPLTGEAGEDAGDVRIDDRGIGLEREREHRPRGVGADAGEREQAVERSREPAEFGDRLRGGMEVAGATRIAEPLPQSEDIAEWRSRACGRRREGLEQREPARDHPLDLGLLEHDLAHEHCPWVAGTPPRQVAQLGNAPVQELVLVHQVR